jgi:hypothetical protein
LRRPRRMSVGRDVRAIRRSLASIARALGRLAPAFEVAIRDSGNDSPNPGRRSRKFKLSPARRAALRLQGQYMGYLRSLKPKQKAQVKALRAAKGVGRAIRLARKLARVPDRD